MLDYKEMCSVLFLFFSKKIVEEAIVKFCLSSTLLV